VVLVVATAAVAATIKTDGKIVRYKKDLHQPGGLFVYMDADLHCLINKYNMAKSKETFNKKEKEKKRLKQRQEKREKMEYRKANASKSQSLDDMMAYLDENGNLTSTPPDPRQRREFKVEEIQIGVPKLEAGEGEEDSRSGTVNFFDDKKGFGFIIDNQTGERIFVHINQLSGPLTANDKVTYDVERGAKGLVAVNVTKL